MIPLINLIWNPAEFAGGRTRAEQKQRIYLYLYLQILNYTRPRVLICLVSSSESYILCFFSLTSVFSSREAPISLPVLFKILRDVKLEISHTLRISQIPNKVKCQSY